MSESKTKQSVAVLGLGYVGCVSAACLARLGHRVHGVDPDATKINSILESRAPFYEPGLEEIVRETVANGRLSATAELAPALAEADVALVCVGTPSARNGDLSTEQLENVFGQIARNIEGRSKPLIVAIRSTVFPGTTERLAGPLQAGNPNVKVVSNPEFLREGAAIADFMDPSLLVVGGDPDAAAAVANLYRGLPVEPSLVSLRTAEMIKYCCNAFHALKVAFANEVGALSDKLDIPALEVMSTLCKDTRLNISAAYLKPGFAFGGSCLPKDLRALTFRGSRLDLDLPLLNSVLPSNERHIDRGVELVLETGVERIGVFGLAFKENTDDLRESPVVASIERWLGKGKHLSVFDPHIQMSRIYGANRQFILKKIPHIEKLLAESLEAMLAWSECVVVMQKPDPAAAAAIAASAKPIVNLVGAQIGAHAG